MQKLSGLPDMRPKLIAIRLTLTRRCEVSGFRLLCRAELNDSVAKTLSTSILIVKLTRR